MDDADGFVLDFVFTLISMLTVIKGNRRDVVIVVFDGRTEKGKTKKLAIGRRYGNFSSFIGFSS